MLPRFPPMSFFDSLSTHPGTQMNSDPTCCIIIFYSAQVIYNCKNDLELILAIYQVKWHLQLNLMIDGVNDQPGHRNIVSQ